MPVKTKDCLLAVWSSSDVFSSLSLHGLHVSMLNLQTAIRIKVTPTDSRIGPSNWVHSRWVMPSYFIHPITVKVIPTSPKNTPEKSRVVPALSPSDTRASDLFGWQGVTEKTFKEKSSTLLLFCSITEYNVSSPSRERGLVKDLVEHLKSKVQVSYTRTSCVYG